VYLAVLLTHKKDDLSISILIFTKCSISRDTKTCQPKEVVNEHFLSMFACSSKKPLLGLKTLFIKVVFILLI